MKIKDIVKNFRPTPTWQRRNAARDAFIEKTIRVEGSDLRKQVRALYPHMEDQFVDAHIRAHLEHVFWRSYNAINAQDLLK